MEFTIPVVRIGYASKDIKVTADSLEEAQEKALEEAGNYEYSEHSSEYFLDGAPSPIRWFVVQESGGKFSDGYYGWDAQIHSDAQIFAESELPYVVCPEFKRILVAERQHKPGLEEVLKFLEENYA